MILVDLFVLSSAIEPFGMVLIESISAEVPVLASMTGGATEIMSDAEMIFPIGDVDECAKQIQKVYNWDDELREQSVLRAERHLRENFSVEVFYKNFWALPFAKKIGIR